MTVVLIGGGWNDTSGYRAFLEAAGPDPTIACVVIDEGDGAEYADRFVTALRSVASCRPQPELVPLGTEVRPDFLDDASALLVCGGLTPAYATALAPVADRIRSRVAAGMPYAGFSAGSAVAAETAIVGGYRVDGRVVCPEDAGEDLEEVTVVPGLGLVPYAVDVHAAQWGTLGRLQAAVATGLVGEGIAIDEDTALVIESGSAARVVGAGAAHRVRRDPAGVITSSSPAGDAVSLRS
jgi:cyanophycinase